MISATVILASVFAWVLFEVIRHFVRWLMKIDDGFEYLEHYENPESPPTPNSTGYDVDALVAQATAVGAWRRVLAASNFEAGAREALSLTGAVLENVEEFVSDYIVRFQFQGELFECVVEPVTMKVLDAGICLYDDDTGFEGDTLFTLESLPAVIREAMLLDELEKTRLGH